MTEVIINENSKILTDDNKAILAPEPAKSWFYVTEYDSNGYPIKAKTIGCSGDMPYSYMYGTDEDNSTDYKKNIITRSLQKFEINNGVTSVGNTAFHKCLSLTSIIIPDSVTSLRSGAFAYCNSLKSIKIPDSVTRIEYSTFSYCSSLTSIIIPDSVTYLGSYAFSVCSGLTNVIIGNGITSLNEETFSSCSNLTSINIPNNVTSIGNRAFCYCSKLKTITFGSGITSIGYAAFDSCSNITLYDFRKATQVPTLSNTYSLSLSSSTKIVVPDSLYKSWKSATNWSGFASYIVKASAYKENL